MWCHFCPYETRRPVAVCNEFGAGACDRHISALWAETFNQKRTELRDAA